MKKRLRKKKRIAEFQEFGFKAGFRFSDRLTLQARNELMISSILSLGVEFMLSVAFGNKLQVIFLKISLFIFIL